MKNHNAMVRKSVPESNILIVDFKSGWADICNFLGKEIPAEDFPHKNKNSAITNEVFYGKPISLVIERVVKPIIL